MPSLGLNSKGRQHENNDSDDPNNTSEWIVVKKKHKKKTFESVIVSQSQVDNVIIPQSCHNMIKIVGNKLVLICSLSTRDYDRDGMHFKDTYFMKNYESILNGTLKIILYGRKREKWV